MAIFKLTKQKKKKTFSFSHLILSQQKNMKSVFASEVFVSSKRVDLNDFIFIMLHKHLLVFEVIIA